MLCRQVVDKGAKSDSLDGALDLNFDPYNLRRFCV